MPNPVVHFEVGSPDRAKSAAFYIALFDWSVSEQGPALLIATGGTNGVTGHFTTLGHEPHKYTIFYVQVEDVKAHLAKAESLGAKTLVPAVFIGTGTFAWISDPDGNTVGLWQPAA